MTELPPTGYVCAEIIMQDPSSEELLALRALAASYGRRVVYAELPYEVAQEVLATQAVMVSESLLTTMDIQARLNTDIQETGVSVRTAHLLKRRNLITMRDVLVAGSERISTLYGVGDLTMRELIIATTQVVEEVPWQAAPDAAYIAQFCYDWQPLTTWCLPFEEDERQRLERLRLSVERATVAEVLQLSCDEMFARDRTFPGKKPTMTERGTYADLQMVAQDFAQQFYRARQAG